MPRYLIQCSYTTEGVKGLLKEGGTKRREAAGRAAESLGGRLEAFYFGFGETDVYEIVELPDSVSVVAGTLALHASGAAHQKVTILVTAEEMDQATQKSVDYRPPGH